MSGSLICAIFLVSVNASGVRQHASQPEIESDRLINHSRIVRRAQSSQLFSTVSRTLLVYSLRLSLYRLLASTFAGLLVFGSLSKLCTLVKIAATSYVGLQRFCKMSKHSSPVAYTLGWNICEMNLTPGGLLGYCSSKCMTRRKVPSSKGVSEGPMMTAFLWSSVSLVFGCALEACSDHLPGHDIIRDRRSRDASRRVSLHALEVAHQASSRRCRHVGW